MLSLPLPIKHIPDSLCLSRNCYSKGFLPFRIQCSLFFNLQMACIFLTFDIAFTSLFRTAMSVVLLIGLLVSLLSLLCISFSEKLKIISAYNTVTTYRASTACFYKFIFMRGSRGGDRGSGPPLKNHKNIGFLSNTGPDPLKITKISSQHSMLGHGPSLAHQRNAI